MYSKCVLAIKNYFMVIVIKFALPQLLPNSFQLALNQNWSGEILLLSVNLWPWNNFFANWVLYQEKKVFNPDVLITSTSLIKDSLD